LFGSKSSRREAQLRAAGARRERVLARDARGQRTGRLARARVERHAARVEREVSVAAQRRVARGRGAIDRARHFEAAREAGRRAELVTAVDHGRVERESRVGQLEARAREPQRTARERILGIDRHPQRDVAAAHAPSALADRHPRGRARWRRGSPRRAAPSRRRRSRAPACPPRSARTRRLRARVRGRARAVRPAARARGSRAASRAAHPLATAARPDRVRGARVAAIPR
jgi:hypothetical protein